MTILLLSVADDVAKGYLWGGRAQGAAKCLY